MSTTYTSIDGRTCITGLTGAARLARERMLKREEARRRRERNKASLEQAGRVGSCICGAPQIAHRRIQVATAIGTTIEKRGGCETTGCPGFHEAGV